MILFYSQKHGHVNFMTYTYDSYVEHFECFVLNRTENLKNSKRASGGIIIYVRNDCVSNDTLLFCTGLQIIIFSRE